MAANAVIVSSFSNAIASAEGYGAGSNKPTNTNNPGDIGNTDNGATQSYGTSASGWAALDHQVGLMFSGGSGTVYNPDMSIAEVGSHYATDPNWANNVASKLGVSPSTTLNQIASGEVPINAIARPSSSGASTGQPEPYQGVDNTNPPTAVPVSGSTISDSQIGAVQNAINPPLVISAGLDETAWFDDPNILQVNGATSAIPTPITFAVYFDLEGSPMPLSIKLNASAQTLERSLRHVSSRRQTRTGICVTLWGMQPDTITGSCSTGVFMNQLGLTDFFSVSDIDSNVQALIKEGWDHVYTPGSTPGQDSLTAVRSNANTTPVTLGQDSMRIAAKDAFVEFLMLFKQNGIVWYQKPSTQDSFLQTQLGPNAWSPQTGSSTFQNAARRNDVMTRGGVAMSFRNSIYYGYFNSLTWTEDAEHPFSWNFNFVFQVERTVSTLAIPSTH